MENEKSEMIIRDSFVFYRSFFQQYEKMPSDRLKALLIKIMCEYALNGTDIEEVLKDEPLDESERLLLEVSFVSFYPQIDANNKRFKNGQKGGRPPKGNDAPWSPGSSTTPSIDPDSYY